MASGGREVGQSPVRGGGGKGGKKPPGRGEKGVKGGLEV